MARPAGATSDYKGIACENAYVPLSTDDATTRPAVRVGPIPEALRRYLRAA